MLHPTKYSRASVLNGTGKGLGAVDLTVHALTLQLELILSQSVQLPEPPVLILSSLADVIVNASAAHSTTCQRTEVCTAQGELSGQPIERPSCLFVSDWRCATQRLQIVLKRS